MTYIIKYKKNSWLFWRKKEITYHCLDRSAQLVYQNNKLIQVVENPLDAMLLYYIDGSVERITEWSKYNFQLSPGWKQSVKKQMENETGIDIKLTN